ncbi:MAG: CAP domain-containing protein, partial [bacterium]
MFRLQGSTSRFLLVLLAILTCCGGLANAAPTYVHFDQVGAQTLMLSEINLYRVRHGLRALQLDSTIASVADHHARDMILRNYFDHISPDGEGPQERLAHAGLPYPVGENLGVMRSYGLTTHEIVSGIMDALIASPAHRANLLDPRATHLGLGFCQDMDNQSAFMDLDVGTHSGAGTVVVCQEFIRKPLKNWQQTGADLTAQLAHPYMSVSVEVIDRDTHEVVRYQRLEVVEGTFATDLKLKRPGQYEVRVLGLQDALLQAP